MIFLLLIFMLVNCRNLLIYKGFSVHRGIVLHEARQEMKGLFPGRQQDNPMPVKFVTRY